MNCLIWQVWPLLVPKDDPNRVHTHALVRKAIDSCDKKHIFPCALSHISTYIKLSNGNGDRQKLIFASRHWMPSIR